MEGSDPVRDLNNFLQGHPSGNLTSLLRFRNEQTGPNNQATHQGTYTYLTVNAFAAVRGVIVGTGRGTAIGVAKRLNPAFGILAPVKILLDAAAMAAHSLVLIRGGLTFAARPKYQGRLYGLGEQGDEEAQAPRRSFAGKPEMTHPVEVIGNSRLL
ncbi:hypothetical protein EDB86DRAFT_2827380 [Lactarius hatsudake]|nr:hypothetical protein EDB86DRAFT_2827380 [Lactarius hatsudake]